MIEIPKKNLFSWIGGKKWLENELQLKRRKLLDKENDLNTYIEPFVGGLGSFKSLYPILKEKNCKKIILNDINKVVIETYKNIKFNHEILIKEYLLLEQKFSLKVPEKTYQLHKTKNKLEIKELLQEANSFFMEIRKSFNKSKLEDNVDIKLIAKFLFLQNHCFNGVYRENRKGEYNTPFNWVAIPYKNCEDKTLIFKEYSLFFNENNIHFTNQDALKLTEENLEGNNFFYFDPPYLNENKGENKYNKDSFGINEQENLLKLRKESKYFMYSNHNIKVLNDICINYKFNLEIVKRKNFFSSKSEDRGKEVEELLVSNC